MGILDSLRPQVAIKATPNEFRCVSNAADIRVRPLIRLGAERKIISIGEPALDESEGGLLIRLFDRPSRPRTGWFDSDAFRRFCEYHVLLVTAGWLIGPVVRFEGSERFRSLFDGQETEVLGPPLQAAGVARLRFETVAPAP